MKKISTAWFILFFFWIGFSSFAWSQTQYTIKDQHIRIRVIAPDFFSENEEALVALYFEPDPGWHVYWENPGDSGAAPKFSFTSELAELGPIQWPYPTRLPVAHLTNLGYEGPVAYLFSVRPQHPNFFSIKMNLEWLVCKIECVPGFAKINFFASVHEGPIQWNPKNFDIIKKFSARIPAPVDTAPLKIISAYLDQEFLKVKIQTSEENFKSLDLFPVDGDFVQPSVPEKKESHQEFIFKISSVAPPSRLSFVAVLNGSAWRFDHVSFSSTQPESSSSLLSLIFFAILGGLILNLMPCVFPVISIKTFSLLKTSGAKRVKDCLLYSAGVMTTFVLLGAGFLILRSLGTAVGWGFQLQSPLVILGLIILFWLMALNFLGVFEMGTSVMNFSGKLTNSSSFGTGVLSVFIAAPCTGPFMGAALGAAVTLPALSALMIFLGLGFGLALPFILFAAFPRLLTVLPKPGAWMEVLKQFFAFPLFATTIWLLWVLGHQAETTGWLLATVALFIISWALWLSKYLSSKKNLLLLIITLVVVGFIGRQLQTLSATATVSGVSEWTAYDEDQLLKARQNKQAVFIDFTAAWCITCQVNKQTVLNTSEAQEYFKQNNILLMRADWTRYDPKITTALSKLGRNSVPVYAYYPSDGSEVRLLPQILTLAILKEQTQ